MSQEPIKPTHPRGEAPEPLAGTAAVPIWLIVVFGALFYLCQLYLGDHVGGFDREVYAPFASVDEVAAANPKSEGTKVLLLGAEVFSRTCAACHQPSGSGHEGQAPPLAGSEWVQAAGPNRIVRVVLNGFTGPVTVKGKEWNLNMLAWRDTYDDEHIAAVLSYVRNSWGNHASIVKPEQVAAARKDNHPGPMTAAELLQIPVQ